MTEKIRFPMTENDDPRVPLAKAILTAVFPHCDQWEYTSADTRERFLRGAEAAARMAMGAETEVMAQPEAVRSELWTMKQVLGVIGLYVVGIAFLAVAMVAWF